MTCSRSLKRKLTTGNALGLSAPRMPQRNKRPKHAHAAHRWARDSSLRAVSTTTTTTTTTTTRTTTTTTTTSSSHGGSSSNSSSQQHAGSSSSSHGGSSSNTTSQQHAGSSSPSHGGSSSNSTSQQHAGSSSPSHGGSSSNSTSQQHAGSSSNSTRLVLSYHESHKRKKLSEPGPVTMDMRQHVWHPYKREDGSTYWPKHWPDSL